MPRRSPALLLLLLAAICGVGASLTGAAARRAQQDQPALVKVQWTGDVSDEARVALETRYGLTMPELDEGTSYRYVLRDVSRRNVERLVRDPAVRDTHDIDRAAYRISDAARRITSSDGDRRSSAAFAYTRQGLTVAAAAFALLAAVIAYAPGVLRRTADAVVAVVLNRMPVGSARQVGAFRIAFAALLLAFFVRERVNADAVPTALRAESVGVAERLIGELFIASPWLANWLTPSLIAATLLFAAGVFGRATFALLTAGAMLWGGVYSLRYGGHPASVLLLTMVCLLPSRWSDAWSVDRWVRARRGRPAPTADPRVYGYTFWLPGVVLGVALFAAAVAKLREGGVDWIVNGTIKYHFLTDLPNAPVDWGLAFGAYPALAVAASLAAILIEVGVIVGAASPVYWHRAAAGLGTAALLAGIYLFQGIFWLGWWGLLIAFLPWHQIDRARRDATSDVSARPSRLALACVALTIGVVVQQAVVTWQRAEVGPLFSTYDMYSKTYDGPAAYERAMSDEYRLVARRPGNRVESCRVEANDGPDLLALAEGRAAPSPARVRNAVHDCFGPLTDVERVDVEVARFAIDWQRWRPLGTIRVKSAGPLPAEFTR